jgi:acetyltransferase-like isoleucine patch superfamily enzyme
MSLRHRLLRLLHPLAGPRMVYGWRRADGTWLAHARISTATRIESPERLDIADHVYVGPFNLLDASAGLVLEEGVQVTSHCTLLSHSSHDALRLAGRRYWGLADPPGYVRAATRVGAYSFIGPHSVLAPGAQVGRGCIVRAFSYVGGEVADFAIVAGQPARVVGDTRERDQHFLATHREWRAAYETWAARP